MTPAPPTPPRAVFFDVDFTLIYPGPAFQGTGYRDFCAKHAIAVDPMRFDEAVIGAAPLLDANGGVYDPEIFIDYTRRIIEGMGGTGPRIHDAARNIYDEWSACDHFTLYDDVADVLRMLHVAGLKIGLISNTERCLASFQRHFELEGLFAVTISSSDHGYMKPHPSIFRAALDAVAVEAADAVMVGDSLAHDVEGARSLGMRAILVARAGRSASAPPGVPVVTSLRELPALLLRSR